jgi:hypothetical protein
MHCSIVATRARLQGCGSSGRRRAEGIRPFRGLCPSPAAGNLAAAGIHPHTGEEASQMTEPGPRPAEEPSAPADADTGRRFAGLEERPVAEHVDVFEAEHDRLQRELGTIDQL